MSFSELDVRWGSTLSPFPPGGLSFLLVPGPESRLTNLHCLLLTSAELWEGTRPGAARDE